MKATEEGHTTAAAGVKTVRETSAAFTGVRKACNWVFASNQQIYFNIQQQAIAIQQVSDAMNSLNQATFQTVRGITQVKIGLKNLTKLY